MVLLLLCLVLLPSMACIGRFLYTFKHCACYVYCRTQLHSFAHVCSAQLCVMPG
jgi:hypothetical protein